MSWGEPGGRPLKEGAFLHSSSRQYLTGVDIKNGASNNSLIKPYKWWYYKHWKSVVSYKNISAWTKSTIRMSVSLLEPSLLSRCAHLSPTCHKMLNLKTWSTHVRKLQYMTTKILLHSTCWALVHFWHSRIQNWNVRRAQLIGNGLLGIVFPTGSINLRIQTLFIVKMKPWGVR